MNSATTIGFIATVEPLTVSVAAIFSTLAICASALVYLLERKGKRKKLIEAVYHHIKSTQSNLNSLETAIADSPNRMRADEKYTPYVVVSREDNLAYSDLIELMLSLNSAEEQVILDYFHAQAALHAIAASFATEVFRGLPLEQKIRSMDSLNEFRKETLKFAAAAEAFLEKKRSDKA